jgi:hypothetical protein
MDVAGANAILIAAISKNEAKFLFAIVRLLGSRVNQGSNDYSGVATCKSLQLTEMRLRSDS